MRRSPTLPKLQNLILEQLVQVQYATSAQLQQLCGAQQPDISRAVRALIEAGCVPSGPGATDPIRSHLVVIEQDEPGRTCFVNRAMFTKRWIETLFQKLHPRQVTKAGVFLVHQCLQLVQVTGLGHDRPGRLLPPRWQLNAEQFPADGREVQDHGACK